MWVNRRCACINNSFSFPPPGGSITPWSVGACVVRGVLHCQLHFSFPDRGKLALPANRSGEHHLDNALWRICACTVRHIQSFNLFMDPPFCMVGVHPDTAGHVPRCTVHERGFVFQVNFFYRTNRTHSDEEDCIIIFCPSLRTRSFFLALTEVQFISIFL